MCEIDARHVLESQWSISGNGWRYSRVLMPNARNAHQPRAPSKIMNAPTMDKKIPSTSTIVEPVSVPATMSATPQVSTITPPTNRARRPR